MLNLLFGPLYHKLGRLESEIALAKTARENPEKPILGPQWSENLKQFLSGLKTECDELGFPQSKNHIDRILLKMEYKIDFAYLEIHLDDLHAGILDEGRHHSILCISPERSKLFYDVPSPWDAVAQAFPSAGDDIVAAIQCYMYDENTASVFHSMRVLESGLASFAEALNVPFGTEVWHVVLDQIESETRELERVWPKGINKSSFLQFYSSAAKEFRYFKDGWRNYVSHNKARYDAPQALSVLNHVRDFMIQISSRLSETA